MPTCELQELISHSASLAATYGGKFLNSAFALSFIGALAGAAAGGLAAQRVIEKSKGREERLKEIRNTHAAIMVSFTICNTALALKKQLVQPMFDLFQAEKQSFIEHRDAWQRGQRQDGVRHIFQLDMQEFPAPSLPIDTLKSLVFEHVNAYGKPLSLVTLIENASVGLARSIAKRGSLIELMKSSQEPSDQLAQKYFGEKMASGHTHREYADIVEVILSYTNDLIYFSGQLATELGSYGKARVEVFSKIYGDGAPSIDPPDFSGPKQSGLYPPDSEYNAWSGWIVERQSAAA